MVEFSPLFRGLYCTGRGTRVSLGFVLVQCIGESGIASVADPDPDSQDPGLFSHPDP